MKKVIFLLIAFLALFISGCSKGKMKENLDNELDKYNLEEIILDKISLSDDESLYAIAVNKDLKEVFLKYEEFENSDSIKILEIMDYDLNFSYQDLLKKLEKTEDKDLKNAIIAITNNAKRIEVIDNAEIKEVLQINKFNALAFYYDIEGITNKIVITHDLGDYYIANETTREIYFPIYINYSDFS